MSLNISPKSSPVTINIDNNCNGCCENEKFQCCCFGKKITPENSPQYKFPHGSNLQVPVLTRSHQVENLNAIIRPVLTLEAMQENKEKEELKTEDPIVQRVEKIKKKTFCVIM